jgi:hypothetical protein
LSDPVLGMDCFDNERVRLNAVIDNHLYSIFDFMRLLELPNYFLEIMNRFLEKYIYTMPR